MLKNGMVSNNSNNQAADRLGDMVEYMKTDEYRKSREPKPVKDEAKPLYMKGPNDVGSRPEEVDMMGDDDFEVQQIRARRMAAMKAKQQKAQELKKQGHGIYRDVDEKEFLPEVTSTQFVVCHFYHTKFQRCSLMHDKLGELSARLVQVKFIKINAEEAPFFCDKLSVTVLPCLVMFKNGVAVDRIQGFDGLSNTDSFPVSRLEKRVCKIFGVDMTSEGLDEDATDDF
eukprot:TRINITY_DN43031_c0_g1_i1.p3 TRINITY_DN43031_c0_g1~~TRINITY_DN43031_c0_g1_i1.p3  ORF type:complete len:228 (+),score=104.64 TRINITY_DN43031_c0_g1_i1:73-756(+)